MGGQVERTTLLACVLVVSLLGYISVDCKPQHHNRRTSFRAVAGTADDAPFSASSYDALGIQPTRRGESRGRQHQQAYWWQGPQSPFSEGAAHNQGVSSGSNSRPQTVVGCSGEGCSGPLPGLTASAAVSSSSSSGGSCCNHYWQQPGHPCSTHQGPDCPRDFKCVDYRSCFNGVISPASNPGYASQKPSQDELMKYGRPCGNSGTDVCCQNAPPQPVVQQPVYHPPPPTHKPTYYPPAQQPVVAQTYPPSPPATTPRPVYVPPPTTAPVYVPRPTTTPAYRPPPQTQAAVAAVPQGPQATVIPYPGCAAALKCVLEEYCSIEGIMINTPVFLTEGQKQYRPPLMACLNVETNEVGYCCRDPLYQDPWPAGMPMLAMPKPPPVAPAVVQPIYVPPPPPPPPTQPPFVQCSFSQECVSAQVCSSQSGQFNNQPDARCQSAIDGQVGVCCTRPPPTTTLPPPPPPTEPPFIQCAFSQECVPAHVCSSQLGQFNNQPNARCQSLIDGQAGVCCNRPPPTTTPPPPTEPPFIQCAFSQECVPAHVCSSQLGQFNNQPNARCQSLIDGQPGVCCSRPPSTTVAPPPPREPVVAPPDNTYLPPPVFPPATLPPRPLPTLPPTEPYVPPPPPTFTPRPAPLPTQPVVLVPPPVIEQGYIPPPPPPVAAQVAAGDQCGISRPQGAQQLAAGEAAQGEFPWHAMIAMQNGSMSCSGALIGSRFVATSFHCVRGVEPSNLRVRLGEQRVGAEDELLPHYEIPVSAVVGHPNFAEGSLFHDTAILMLAAAAPSGQAHIAPICLPASPEPQISQCAVSGWGHDTLSGLQVGMLNKVQVDLVRNQDCQTSLQTTHLGKYFKLHQSFTCASTQSSINPCKVDGGSPLACQRPDGSHVLVGLSSWSVGCSNQQQPGVFADVMGVAPWMHQEMAKPEASLVEQSNTAFQSQQQFQSTFGTGAGYGR